MTHVQKPIITNISDLRLILEAYREEGKRIVLTQGTFDLIHIGHARYLAEAKSHGDVLIVGVDSDAKVKERKGPDRPVVPEDERAEMLTYLNSVDVVVVKDSTTPKWGLIKLVRPDILIATKKTYDQSQLEELHNFCGKVEVLDPMAVTSTSAKIRLLQIGAAKKIEAVLSEKLIKTIEEVLRELKGES